ncbi:hypothetical protein IW249_000182 [Micromonospora vinacea]|uniref:Uncharacterized protein n=1 Tax=Micromonospora vinacea TaxID=709878 RepID=A0ABS0JTS9_9ACTN|nr:hypothetical protein [Micromonospora vinacea]
MGVPGRWHGPAPDLAARFRVASQGGPALVE